MFLKSEDRKGGSDFSAERHETSEISHVDVFPLIQIDGVTSF